jgi:universal stress protein A
MVNAWQAVESQVQYDPRKMPTKSRTMKPTSSRKGLTNTRLRKRKPAARAATRKLTKLDVPRILVPVDFSDDSRKTVDRAVAIAKQFDSEIILVHVIEAIVYPTDWMFPLMTSDTKEDRTFLETKLKALAAKHDIKVKVLITVGRAWEEIVNIAKKSKATLIVTGTHGLSGIKHALLGSVAEKVVRHAPCPVLVLK